ncbi:DUF1937 family protein [Rhizobium leucaenae]|uniref:DUF1937 family protein n=1 Tax=Rhizobium leucaenae TaxID=29450 RepID=UPI00048D92B5|nr:DUF1937 family protein [Rhizobium leucaenae]
MTLFGGRIPNEDGDGYKVVPQPYNEPLMIPGYGAQPVPANDNFIADESGASAGFAVGGYIGLRRTPSEMRATHEEHNDNVAKWRANDTLPYRKQQGVEALAELAGYVYLGSPYAKYPHGLDEAARVVSECAGVLMQRGLRIYCPIAHGHAVSRNVALPREWDFWKAQDQPLIDAAAAIIVLEMQGWRESVGLTYEISEFMRAGKPILYLEPADLRVSERRAAA